MESFEDEINIIRIPKVWDIVRFSEICSLLFLINYWITSPFDFFWLKTMLKTVSFAMTKAVTFHCLVQKIIKRKIDFPISISVTILTYLFKPLRFGNYSGLAAMSLLWHSFLTPAKPFSSIKIWAIALKFITLSKLCEIFIKHNAFPFQSAANAHKLLKKCMF